MTCKHKLNLKRFKKKKAAVTVMKTTFIHVQMIKSMNTMFIMSRTVSVLKTATQ